MAYKISNFARMSLVQSVAAASTSMFVSAEDGDLLPVLGVSDIAPAVLFNSSAQEIVYITAEADGELTVTRGQESTAARDWPSGTIILHTPTAALFQLVLNASFAVNSFFGPATNIGNAYTVDVGAGNPIPDLNDGERVSFLVPATNVAPGPATLVVTDGTSSTVSKALVLSSGDPLVEGDLTIGFLAEARFDAVNDVWVLLTNTSLNLYATNLNSGPLPAVNRHPNGRLDAWNSGVSFSTPASASETADSWVVEYDGTIGTFTINRQAFTPGQTDIPGDPRWFLRWDHSVAGSGSTFRRFRVELPGVHWRNGETITRSVWLKADAARNVTTQIVQYFGTGGAPSADVVVDSTVRALTTSWQRFDLTVDLPSISGKTIGSDLNDALALVFDLPLNVAMTIDIANDDLRPGPNIGSQSDTFPLPTWLGGTGGSFEDQTALGDSLDSVVHLTGEETITGNKIFRGAVNAPLITFENTTTSHEVENRFASAGVLYEMTPSPSGVPDATKGFGFDFTNSSWFVDTALVVLGQVQVSTGAPGICSGGDTDTGIEFANGDLMYAYGNGARTWLLSGNLVAQGGQAVRVGGGNAAFPTLAFANATTTGLFNSAGDLGFSITGTQKALLAAAALTMATGVDIVLPATAHAPSSVFSAGYRGAPVVSGNSAYAFPAAEAGHTVYHDEAGTRTYTIPANASVAHPIGTVFIIDNTGNSGAAGAITLQITTDTLRRGDGTVGTGSRTIPASAVAAIRKVSATVWVITGIFS